MRVGFDILPLDSGHKARGMGQYARMLLENLKGNNDIEIVEFTDIKKLKDTDLIHYPYFDQFFLSLPIRKKFPTVVTIGDITPILFPSHYPPGIKGFIKNKIQRFSLKGVNVIITFSESARNDIVKVLKISKDKIFPIYLGVSENFKIIKDNNKIENTKKKYNLPDQFALFVGSVNWNKNLLNLTEGALRANIKIVMVGKSFEQRENLDHPELQSYKKFLEKYSDNPNVVILGFVEDEDLVAIYNLTSVLLLSSYYEGFGLPILEAQACGVPVITSKVSSMPEVAGDGAVLVDPNSVDEIVEAIRKITTDKNLRGELVRRGLENIKRFSWEKCAKETIEVYKYALKH